MKLVLTIIYFLLPILVFAQTDLELLDRLDKASLISAYEKKEYLKDLNARTAHLDKLGKEESEFHREEEKQLRQEPHYILNLLARCKMYSTSGTISIVFTPAPVKIPRGEEKTFIQRHENFIRKIAAANLISKPTLNIGLEEIRKLNIRSPYEVADYVSSLTEFEHFLKWENYGKFLDTLLARKIISAGNYDIVKKKLLANEFHYYGEPLEYLENLAIIDLSQYKDDPEIFMEPVYRVTSKALPELAFDSLNFKVNVDKVFDGFTFYDMLVRINKGENQYVYSSYFDLAPKNKSRVKTEFRSVRIPENHHYVFNKMLADQGSPYRLHQMPLGKNKLGIIALTKTQFDQLMWSYSGQGAGYISLSYENFNSRVTLRNIRKAVHLFDSLGLFDHLTADEKLTGLKSMESNSIEHFTDILSSFKDVTLEIDLEYGIAKKQYENLTRKLAAISKGNFVPTNIIDTYDFNRNKKFQYGFTVNGKSYISELNQEDDWLDLEFFSLIEKALREQQPNGAFYMLYPNDGFRYIYLTHQQADILKDAKLLELTAEEIDDN